MTWYRWKDIGTYKTEALGRLGSLFRDVPMRTLGEWFKERNCFYYPAKLLSLERVKTGVYSKMNRKRQFRVEMIVHAEMVLELAWEKGMEDAEKAVKDAEKAVKDAERLEQLEDERAERGEFVCFCVNGPE